MKRKPTPAIRVNNMMPRPSIAQPLVGRFSRWMLQREVWGLILVAFGVVLVTSLLAGGEGKVSEAWAWALRRAFGIGTYPVVVVIIASGLLLLLWNTVNVHLRPRWPVVIGYELLFFVGLGLVHLLGTSDPLEWANDGCGGGYIGWAFWQLLVPWFGRTLSSGLLIAIMLVGFCLVLGVSRETPVLALLLALGEGRPMVEVRAH